jgi:hypothetical protein
VDWFFTAVLVIMALCATGFAGRTAYRMYERQR